MNYPYKLTPIYKWHLQHGAHMAEVFGWKRVIDYGDPKAEVAAILSSVGLSDLTLLTKIDVQGRQTPDVLEERFGRIPEVGECAPALNAEVSRSLTYIARLTRERFIVLDSPEEGARLYKSLADAGAGDACVHATDITSAYAVLQLAGPTSTELMKRLCSVRVDGVTSDRCFQCPVVGIRALVIRRDMGNVPCWLLLVSRDFGEYAWECVYSAGHEFGIRPFGTAAEQAFRSAESTNVSVV